MEDMLDDLRECCPVELSGQQMTDPEEWRSDSIIKKADTSFSAVGSFLKKKKRCTSAIIQP